MELQVQDHQQQVTIDRDGSSYHRWKRSANPGMKTGVGTQCVAIHMYAALVGEITLPHLANGLCEPWDHQVAG